MLHKSTVHGFSRNVPTIDGAARADPKVYLYPACSAYCRKPLSYQSSNHGEMKSACRVDRMQGPLHPEHQAFSGKKEG